MSDEFRKNLMGPEPTLLPAETEVYAQLDAGQEALDLVMLPADREWPSVAQHRHSAATQG